MKRKRNYAVVGLILLCVLPILVLNFVKVFPQSYLPLPGATYPQWEGIRVGTSTYDDVVHLLGEPQPKGKGLAYDFFDQFFTGDLEWWIFTYPSTTSEINFAFRRTDKIVQFISSPDIDSVTPKSPSNVEQFIELSGNPELVTWGTTGACTRYFIWATKGLAIEGTVPAWARDDAFVLRVEYFVPTDVKTYLHSWGRLHLPCKKCKSFGEEDAYHHPELPFPYQCLE